MKNYKDIGVRIRLLRGPDTQPVFSKKMGISLPALQNYEAGKRVPRGDALRRIALLTGQTVDWILFGKEHEPTMEEARDLVRRMLAIEHLDYSEEVVERMAIDYLLQTKEAKAASFALEIVARLEDDEINRIMEALKNMDKESVQDVLKYAEEKKIVSTHRREKRLKDG